MVGLDEFLEPSTDAQGRCGDLSHAGLTLNDMPLYAEFAGDEERFRFEVDEDGIIWNPPIAVSSWLVGHPTQQPLLLRRKKTVLLADVQLAHYRSSYSYVARINEDGSQIRDSDSVVLGVELTCLSSGAARVVRQVGTLSDNARDEKALEELGERGSPVPEREWDLLRTAIAGRRTPQQRERIERVLSALGEGGPEQAQPLLDRLLDLKEDDRAMLQRRIRQWPHRIRPRSRSADSSLFRRRRPRPPGGEAETP